MSTERASPAKDKPMEDSRRKILETATEDLVKDMNVEEVLVKMPLVFTPGEKEKIKSMPTRRKRCEELLDILPTRGDKAFYIFKEALKEVSSHLISALDKAEINIERQRSAGLQGKIRYLEKELKTVADERDELRKQLDESNELPKNDLKKFLEGLVGKTKTIEELKTALDDERKKKEEIEKDRDELRKKLQDKEEELTNAFKSRLIEVVNEKGTATGQTELTDLNNNELQPSPTVRGLEVTTEESACTEEEKVKTIFRQLEHYRKEEMQLFEKAKELIENYFENTSADLDGDSQGVPKRKPNPIQKRKTPIKSLERERELVKQKNELQKEKEALQSRNETLVKRVKAKENAIKEGDERLSEVQEMCDKLQQQSDDYSGRVIELQEDLRKWQDRSKTLEDEIHKSRIFLNGIFLPFVDDGKPSVDVIHHLKNKTSAKVIATRSSDGPGEAIDVLLNRKGQTCGTEQKPNSWWWIDLGENHLLFITHYALTDRKRDPALTMLQLKGSTDGHKWTNLSKTHIKDRTDSSHLTTTWRVNGEMAGYRYFKIFHSANGIRLSGIWLYGVLLEVKALSEFLKLSPGAEC